MLKIAFINTEWLPIPPVKGGAVEEWIQQVSHLLGEDIFVFSIFHPSLPQLHKDGQVAYYHFKPNRLARLLLSTYRLPFKKESSYLYYLPYSFWCAWKLRSIKPDIIHIHNRPQFVRIIRLLNPEAKIVLHIHQLSAMEERNLWTKKFIDSVDLLLGCSNFIVNQIKKHFPLIKPEKIGMVYNGLDMGAIQTKREQEEKIPGLSARYSLEGSKVILYVGRLVENKGADLLIGALRDLIKNGKRNLKLILCGAAGYSRNELTPYIKKLHDLSEEIKDNVVFTGYVSHEDLLDYYLVADLVVIPSLVEEGFCIVAIEAMAFGVPLIVPNRGGLGELVQDLGGGKLLDKVSEKTIEEAVEDFFLNEEKYKLSSKKNMKRVSQEFAWDKICGDVLVYYKELVSNG